MSLNLKLDLFDEIKKTIELHSKKKKSHVSKVKNGNTSPIRMTNQWEK